MKACITIILTLLLSLEMVAQTPYSGGAGDGFAWDGLEFETVGTRDRESSLLNVYPSPAHSGGQVSANVDEMVTYVELLALNGRVLDQISPSYGMAQWLLPDIPAGSYVLRIIGQSGRIYHARIIVLGQ